MEEVSWLGYAAGGDADVEEKVVAGGTQTIVAGQPMKVLSFSFTVAAKGGSTSVPTIVTAPVTVGAARHCKAVVTDSKRRRCV
jgi:hypothetical protein